VQGLIIYDVVAQDFYGVSIPKNRKNEIHIRPVEKLLDTIISLDNSPLTNSRDLSRRLVGRCHHYARLLVAILRAKGIPARSRCGFAAYFNPGSFEDHSVCEYWNTKEKRWLLVDAQLDEVWQKKLHINFDIYEVPHNQFIVAADAWTSCRTGKADPQKFGISFNNLHGLWFIAVSLVHDVAVLNKKEVLQWDTWGAQPKPDEQLNEDQLSYFDKLAALTCEPDKFHSTLLQLYEQDERLRVPSTVFNTLLQREEAINP
jgi:hypothetical protein